ncbi:MAG: hypothetical protein HY305_03335 [Sphingobacteriales bacterium]|nr:hypothetical protein [Sphingobacteriales bacterium]
MLILLTKHAVSRPFYFHVSNIKMAIDTLPAPGDIDLFGDKELVILKDTGTAALKDSSLKKDTTLLIAETDTFHFKIAKNTLDAPVVYHADDSMILDVPAKKVILYGKKSKTTYQDNNLTAPGIEFDQSTGFVTASISKDSAGKVIAFPTFQQKDFKTVSDTIRFNMKTKKGLTKGTYTQQGEMFVYGEKIKKINDDVFYAYRARFTTCALDTPHFAFVSTKIKLSRI